MSRSRYFPPGLDASSKAYEILMDQLMSKVSGGAWKVACFIARRTVGWGKETDRISLSQFCRGVKRAAKGGTGLNRTAVIRGLRELQCQGVITKTPAHGRQSARYSIDWCAFRQSQSETSSDSLPVSSSESGPGLVANRDPQPTVLQPAVVQPTGENRDIDFLAPSFAPLKTLPGDGSPALLKPEDVQELVRGWTGGRVPVSHAEAASIVTAADGMNQSQFRAFFEDDVFRQNRGRYHPGKTKGPHHANWFKQVLDEKAGRAKPGNEL
jgi:hypothetical protein